jgi:predicted flap endonuclease-1-like 5' DNA nuclease
MSPNQNLQRAHSDRCLWLWVLPGIAFLASLLYLLWKKRVEQGNIQPVRIDLSFVRQSSAGAPPVSAPVSPVTEIPIPVQVEEPVPPAAEPSISTLPEEQVPGEPSTPLPVAPVAASQPDDLVVLIGIGPKVAAVLRAAGIDTFARLAQSDPIDLRKILDDAGLRLPDPTTWPEQARLALEGHWQEMKEIVARYRASHNS